MYISNQYCLCSSFPFIYESSMVLHGQSTIKGCCLLIDFTGNIGCIMYVINQTHRVISKFRFLNTKSTNFKFTPKSHGTALLKF